MWIMAMRIQASLRVSRPRCAYPGLAALLALLEVLEQTAQLAPPGEGGLHDPKVGSTTQRRGSTTKPFCPSSLSLELRHDLEDPADKRIQPTKRAAQKARGPVAQSALSLRAPLS